MKKVEIIGDLNGWQYFILNGTYYKGRIDKSKITKKRRISQNDVNLQIMLEAKQKGALKELQEAINRLLKIPLLEERNWNEENKNKNKPGMSDWNNPKTQMTILEKEERKKRVG